jgi:hypothetical protein
MTSSLNSLDNINEPIKGIDIPVICRYFTSINGGEFSKTAALFAEDGTLYAPFETGIKGREAIAIYLEKEAQGFKLYPCQGITEIVEENLQTIKVSGRVQTPFFTVNVSWQFLLNFDQQIIFVKVKLLASPQELLQLKQIS